MIYTFELLLTLSLYLFFVFFVPSTLIAQMAIGVWPFQSFFFNILLNAMLITQMVIGIKFYYYIFRSFGQSPKW